jgi:hypothetical protein
MSLIIKVNNLLLNQVYEFLKREVDTATEKNLKIKLDQMRHAKEDNSMIYKLKLESKF